MVKAFIDNSSSSVETRKLKSEQLHEIEQTLTEGDLESVINFKDYNAAIKIKTTDSKVRIYNTSIIKQFKNLYKGCCQLCGQKPFDAFDTDICEAHHIVPFSQNQNNDAKNIIILCPNHHRLIHKLNPVYDDERKCFIYSDGTEETVKLNYHL